MENDLKEGKGIMTYNNGDKYEGEYKNDLKEGKGIMIYNNGDKYEGEFKNNEIIKGKGEMIFQNYIICEYSIKYNSEIFIFNSFEEVKKKNSLIEGKENEKELREYCELYLNEEKISFTFKKKFENKSIYILKIKCKQLLNNINCMFYECSSLTSLNLSNFNTNNVIDMCAMFQLCSSLTSLNLSNFNTNNVTNMCAMFQLCSSLTSLNLSNFNTNNITDMSEMFSGINKGCNLICNDKTLLNQFS